MATQRISVERRDHRRESVIGQLEDITYAVLRKYGVIRELKTEQATSCTRPTTAINHTSPLVA